MAFAGNGINSVTLTGAGYVEEKYLNSGSTSSLHHCKGSEVEKSGQDRKSVV